MNHTVLAKNQIVQLRIRPSTNSTFPECYTTPSSLFLLLSCVVLCCVAAQGALFYFVSQPQSLKSDRCFSWMLTSSNCYIFQSLTISIIWSTPEFEYRMGGGNIWSTPEHRSEVNIITLTQEDLSMHLMLHFKPRRFYRGPYLYLFLFYMSNYESMIQIFFFPPANPIINHLPCTSIFVQPINHFTCLESFLILGFTK